MAQTLQFFEERAEEAAEEARNAVLENVRDRALRSEAAWRGMARRAREIAEGRMRRDADSSKDAELPS